MAQLDDMLARLLADQHFIKVYTFTPRTYGQRRAFIGEFFWGRHLTNLSIGDREQLRRALD